MLNVVMLNIVILLIAAPIKKGFTVKNFFQRFVII
jgi:hypothetical protein